MFTGSVKLFKLIILVSILVLSILSFLTIIVETNNIQHYELKELWSTNVLGSYLYSLDWSPDGKYIAIGTADNLGYLKIYNALSGKCLWEIELGDNIQFIDWSPKGRFIAVVTPYTLYVIDAYSHKIIWNKEIDDRIYIAVWSPDGEYLAVGSHSKLYLFVETGSLLWVSPRYDEAEIKSIAWSHKGDMFAFAGGNLGYELKVYRLIKNNTSSNINQVKNISVVQVSSFNIDDKIYSIEWSPNDKFIAVGSEHFIYDISIYGSLIWRKPGTTVIGATWSFNGEYLAVLDISGITLYTNVGERLWYKSVDLHISYVVGNYNNGLIQWGPDNLIAVGEKYDICIFDINGTIIAKGKYPGSYLGTSRIAWSPDMKYLATVGEDEKLHVWILERVFYSTIKVEKTTYPYKICFIRNDTTIFCDTINTTSKEYSVEPGIYTVTYYPLITPHNIAGEASNILLKKIYEFRENNTYTLIPPNITDYFYIIEVNNPLPKDLILRITWDTGYKDFNIGSNTTIKIYTVPDSKYLVYVKAENNTWIKIYETYSKAGGSIIVDIPKNILMERTTNLSTGIISTETSSTLKTTSSTISPIISTTQTHVSNTQTGIFQTEIMTNESLSQSSSTGNMLFLFPSSITYPFLIIISLGLLAIILYHLKHRSERKKYEVGRKHTIIDRTADLISREEQPITKIEDLLQTKLMGLKKDYGCSGEWVSTRLLKGTVPDEFVGNWSCCKLGCGGWGCSYLCIKDNRKIVVKIPHGYESIILGGLPPSIHVRLLEKIVEKAETIKRLEHPNILKLLGAGKQIPMLIYEYADYGTLEWQLAKGWKPSKRDLLLLILQIADALRYIHGRGLIHGDIKPNNIFIVKGIVKIGDFSGLKKLLSLTSSRSGIASTYTIGFRAPEQVYRDLREKAYKLGLEHMIDIYCLGNTILYTLIGETVDGEDATPDKIDSMISKISDYEIGSLLRKMLDPEPWNRPTAMDIIRTVLIILNNENKDKSKIS